MTQRIWKRLLILGAVLFAVELSFWYLSLHPLPWYATRQWFDLDVEHSVPVWFSSTQLTATAAIAGYCAWQERVRVGGLRRSLWLVPASLFLYLSLDETAVVHEIIGGWLSRRVSFIPAFNRSGGIPYWLVVFLPGIAAAIWGLATLARRSFQGQPMLRWLIWFGLLSWIGVLGLEAAATSTKVTVVMPRILLVGLEEVLEMAGATWFLLAFLGYAAMPRERL